MVLCNANVTVTLIKRLYIHEWITNLPSDFPVG